MTHKVEAFITRNRLELWVGFQAERGAVTMGVTLLPQEFGISDFTKARDLTESELEQVLDRLASPALFRVVDAEGGFHSHEPRRNFTPMGKCPWREEGTCHYDGSYGFGMSLLSFLRTGGLTGLLDYMQERYETEFGERW